MHDVYIHHTWKLVTSGMKNIHAKHILIIHACAWGYSSGFVKGQTFVAPAATGSHAPGVPVRGLSDEDLPPAIYVAGLYKCMFSDCDLI